MDNGQLATALQRELGRFVGRELTPECWEEMEAAVARVADVPSASLRRVTGPGVAGIKFSVGGVVFQADIGSGLPSVASPAPAP